MKGPEELTVAEVEEAIGRPFPDWEGNCYGTAVAIVEAGLVEGKAVYGFWIGKIHPASLFAGRPLTHHAWIELPDGRIFDPTRWCFEVKEPYLFIGTYKENKEYDRGGQEVVKMMRGEYPDYKPDEEQFHIPDNIRNPLRDITGLDIQINLSFHQVRWLAHLTPDEIGFEICKSLFSWLQDNNLRVLVPMDIWDLVGI